MFERHPSDSERSVLGCGFILSRIYARPSGAKLVIEPRLKELSGSSRLALGFFNSLIRRIECTKPLAGAGVTISEKPDGIEISSSGGGAVNGYSDVTLNVCSNGVPTTIVVLAK